MVRQGPEKPEAARRRDASAPEGASAPRGAVSGRARAVRVALLGLGVAGLGLGPAVLDGVPATVAWMLGAGALLLLALPLVRSARDARGDTESVLARAADGGPTAEAPAMGGVPAERASRHRAVLRGLRDAVVLVDSDGAVAWVTPSAAELFATPAAELVGRRVDSLVHPEEAKAVRAFLRAVTKDGAPDGDRRAEWRVRRPDRATRYAEAVVTDLRDDPLVRGVVITLRDVTERRRQQEELERHAFQDALTGLANRARFHDRLNHALERLKRQPLSVAVFFIDVDHFKTINDTWGHAAGDAVLTAVAQRLLRSIRSSDTAARLAGDEFAVLLEDLTDPLQAERVAERVSRSVREPVPVGGQTIQVTVSLGVAVTAGSGTTAEDLLRNADTAMYAAKQAGRGCWRTFDPASSSGELPRLVVPRDDPAQRTRQPKAGGRPTPLSPASRFRHPSKRHSPSV